MIRTDLGYALSSGRELYANAGILGLSPDYPGCVYEGYDGEAHNDLSAVYPECSDYPPLTPQERREVAEFMAALWMQWAGKEHGEQS